MAKKLVPTKSLTLNFVYELHTHGWGTGTAKDHLTKTVGEYMSMRFTKARSPTPPAEKCAPRCLHALATILPTEKAPPEENFVIFTAR